MLLHNTFLPLNELYSLTAQLDYNVEGNSANHAIVVTELFSILNFVFWFFLCEKWEISDTAIATKWLWSGQHS